MKFNLALPYIIKDEDKKQDPYLKTGRNVSEFLIRAGFNGKYPQGTKVRAEQRTQKRIFDALNLALKSEQDHIDITEADLKFVRDCLADWSVPPGSPSSWFIDLFDYIEDTIHQIESAKKTPATVGV